MKTLQTIMIVIVTAQFILFLLGFLFPKDKKSSFFRNTVYLVVCCFIIIELVTSIPKSFQLRNPLKPILNSSAETELLDFQDYLDKYKDLITSILE